MMNEVKNRLMGALAHIGYAIELAKAQEPNGQVLLTVTTKSTDDMGCIIASFVAEPFFLDVVKLLGFENPEAMLEHMLKEKT